jgi:hypothetical protein
MPVGGGGWDSSHRPIPQEGEMVRRRKLRDIIWTAQSMLDIQDLGMTVFDIDSVLEDPLFQLAGLSLPSQFFLDRQSKVFEVKVDLESNGVGRAALVLTVLVDSESIQLIRIEDISSSLTKRAA